MPLVGDACGVIEATGDAEEDVDEPQPARTATAASATSVATMLTIRVFLFTLLSSASPLRAALTAKAAPW